MAIMEGMQIAEGEKVGECSCAHVSAHNTAHPPSLLYSTTQHRITVTFILYYRAAVHTRSGCTALAGALG